MMMNMIKVAVYSACRDFSKMNPDIFVFADFDEAHENVEIFMEYTGFFAGLDLEGPKVSRIISYKEITSTAMTSRKVVECHLSGMESSLISNFMLSRRRTIGMELGVKP